MKKEKVKTMKLEECKGMLKKIAEVMIKEHGEYLCLVDGEKTRIVK